MAGLSRRRRVAKGTKAEISGKRTPAENAGVLFNMRKFERGIVMKKYRIMVENSRLDEIGGEMRMDIFGVMQNAFGYSFMMDFPDRGVLFFEGSHALSKDQLQSFVDMFPRVLVSYVTFNDEYSAESEKYIGELFDEWVPQYQFNV